MNRKFVAMFLFIGIFAVVCANAKSNFIGKYSSQVKMENGQTYDVSFELKANKMVVFRSENTTLEESVCKKGTWNWDNQKKLLSLKTPKMKATALQQALEKVVIIFKQDGKNLRVVNVSPSVVGKTGRIFRRI